MAGGFSRPKKDKGVKVTDGQTVRTGQILIKAMPSYKAGRNTKGTGAIFSLCSGSVYFSRVKTPHGKFRTFVNVKPAG